MEHCNLVFVWQTSNLIFFYIREVGDVGGMSDTDIWGCKMFGKREISFIFCAPRSRTWKNSQIIQLFILSFIMTSVGTEKNNMPHYIQFAWYFGTINLEAINKDVWGTCGKYPLVINMLKIRPGSSPIYSMNPSPSAVVSNLFIITTHLDMLLSNIPCSFQYIIESPLGLLLGSGRPTTHSICLHRPQNAPRKQGERLNRMAMEVSRSCPVVETRDW